MSLADIVLLVLLEKSTEEQPVHTIINQIAELGCCGFLTTDPLSSASTTFDTIFRSDNSQSEAMKSSSAMACDLAKRQDFSTVHQFSSNKNENGKIIDALYNLLFSLKDTDSKQKHLIILDLSYEPADLSTVPWAVEILKKTLFMQKEGYNCIITMVQATCGPYQPTVTNSISIQVQQSYQEKSDSDKLYGRLLMTNYQPNRTRKDNVQTFSVSDVQAYGAYGAINKLVLLKEIAFRLGVASKYGA